MRKKVIGGTNGGTMGGQKWGKKKGKYKAKGVGSVVKWGVFLLSWGHRDSEKRDKKCIETA